MSCRACAVSRRASHQAAALVALGHAHVLAHGSTRFALGVLVFWVSAMTQNMPHAHTHTLLPCIHHSRDSHDNAHTPRGGNQQPSAARGRRRHRAGSEWPHTSSGLLSASPCLRTRASQVNAPHHPPSPTLSPTDPVPRGLLTLCPGASSTRPSPRTTKRRARQGLRLSVSQLDTACFCNHYRAGMPRMAWLPCL